MPEMKIRRQARDHARVGIVPAPRIARKPLLDEIPQRRPPGRLARHHVRYRRHPGIGPDPLKRLPEVRLRPHARSPKGCLPSSGNGSRYSVASRHILGRMVRAPNSRLSDATRQGPHCGRRSRKNPRHPLHHTPFPPHLHPERIEIRNHRPRPHLPAVRRHLHPGIAPKQLEAYPKPRAAGLDLPQPRHQKRILPHPRAQKSVRQTKDHPKRHLPIPQTTRRPAPAPSCPPPAGPGSSSRPPAPHRRPCAPSVGA
jgi:hypothetical protein